MCFECFEQAIRQLVSSHAWQCSREPRNACHEISEIFDFARGSIHADTGYHPKSIDARLINLFPTSLFDADHTFERTKMTIKQ